MVHTVHLEMGDTLNIELFESTSIERKNVASITVESPGLVVVTTERHENDLRVVFTIE